ncbi:cation transporter [Methylomonas sp. SURF-1]|uniref:Cation transporter n=1 Tax=Methylomonas aurea TaxID=2952224 RepID=A0ABT1UCQ1_9GAMM|nr:cation transporter [Methylomonas sp. SURF-1]MCQ8179524.1 cation transporter [Methylomonas sp. SURF-1]
MSTPHTEHHTEHPTDHTLTLAIAGMTCASCAGRVEQALAKVAGVRQARVNLAGEIAIVSGDALDLERLQQAVAKAGYRALPGQYRAKSDSERQPGISVMLSAVLSLPLAPPMLLEPFGLHPMLPGWLQLCFASTVQFGLGGGFYRSGWKALRSGSIDGRHRNRRPPRDFDQKCGGIGACAPDLHRDLR